MNATMKAGAVVLLGMVLAGAAWGHSDEAFLRDWSTYLGPSRDVRKTEQYGTWPDVVDFTLTGGVLRTNVRYPCQSYYPRTDPTKPVCLLAAFIYYKGKVEWSAGPSFLADDGIRRSLSIPVGGGVVNWDLAADHRRAGTLNSGNYYGSPPGRLSETLNPNIVIAVSFHNWDRSDNNIVDHSEHIHYRVPPPGGSVTPEPEPETPTPPPEPEPEPETPPPEPPSPPPEPPSPPPEPETPTPPPEPGNPEPDPEPEAPEPDHSHPVQRCDHIAIVPGMPKAIAGDEGTPDHWLRIANPGAAGITFTVTGRDEAGAKGGTYRRELPAYRAVKVDMRDVEAAFDVSKPAGWWTLTVTGSGPLYVAATMRQGDARRFVPVERPAVCGTGPVTRTGAGG